MGVTWYRQKSRFSKSDFREEFVRPRSNPGRFGPIPVRSDRFGLGRFGLIYGMSRFSPTGAGRFGPVPKVGRFGPI